MKQDVIFFGSEDLKKLDKEFRRNFINSLSGYRSVNLCGTVNKKGITNLAIFNTVIHIGSEPPLIGMVIKPSSVPRDTLSNIIETGYYTLNHVAEEFIFKAHQTAARYDSNKSEFEIVKLRPFFTKTLPAPYAEESPVKIGLRLIEQFRLKSNRSTFIVGEVIETIIPSSLILNDGLLNLSLAHVVASSGIDTYYATQKIGRLSYPSPGKDIDLIG
ncbi:MAG: flavin reductase [Bacteroidales bacterium]|nr:flavin reductase [Bacteroidales bacterium]